MGVLTIPGVRLHTISGVVPGNVVSNQNYDRLTPEERDRLIRATGIEERRFVDDGSTTTADLSVQAVRDAMETAGWAADEVGVLVFVSQMRDYIVPTTAPILQQRLGVPTSAIAFDVPLGCSGYVYGLSIAASLLRGTQASKGLLVCGDVSSPLLSPDDKSTYPLFGDASSCTLLERSETAKDMIFDLGTDGSGYDAIIMRDGGCRRPFHEGSLEIKDHGDGIRHSDMQIHLDGYRIFEFAMTQVIQNIHGLLDAAGRTIDDADHIVLHQANGLILDSIRKILNVAPDRIPISLDRYGNTSSASIPLTICSMMERAGTDRLTASLLISGFGVGLSYGSAWVNVQDLRSAGIQDHRPPHDET